MNKKRIVLLTVLSVLVVALAYLLAKNNKSTIKEELRDFRVEDTASVDKIFMANKQNKSVLLERKEDGWQLNEAFEVRNDLINILLKTLHRMRVKEPVPMAARENIIKSLAAKSTKVEIYKKGRLKKVFYVGGPTQNSFGTYMIMENSSAPFIIEIPGFRGYLSTRFSTETKEWRSQKLLSYPYYKVAEVILQNNAKKNQSFMLKKEGGHISLFNPFTMDRLSLVDTLAAKAYIASLRSKNFSQYASFSDPNTADSILSSTPMFTLTVVDTESNEQTLRLFRKPAWGRVDAFGKEMVEDPDYFFIETETKELVYAQYYVFAPLLKQLSHFTK